VSEAINGEAATAESAGRKIVGTPFPKGVSGNPSGRPKVAAEVRELAREHGPAAIARLVELMRSKDEMVAIAACRAILDRGYGRPESTLSLPNGPLVSVTIGNGPITTLEDAVAVYQELVRNPRFDVTKLRFELPAPLETPEVDAIVERPEK
jgi:hypothetical protein